MSISDDSKDSLRKRVAEIKTAIGMVNAEISNVTNKLDQADIRVEAEKAVKADLAAILQNLKNKKAELNAVIDRITVDINL